MPRTQELALGTAALEKLVEYRLATDVKGWKDVEIREKLEEGMSITLTSVFYYRICILLRHVNISFIYLFISLLGLHVLWIQ